MGHGQGYHAMALRGIASYVGIPFEWGGRSHMGADCWGLLCMVQEDVFGRMLPHRVTSLEAVERAVEPQPIDLAVATTGDVLVMRGSNPRGFGRHVGTFVDNERILHTQEESASRIERISKRNLAWRILQAYRLK